MNVIERYGFGSKIWILSFTWAEARVNMANREKKIPLHNILYGCAKKKYYKLIGGNWKREKNGKKQPSTSWQIKKINGINWDRKSLTSVYKKVYRIRRKAAMGMVAEENAEKQSIMYSYRLTQNLNISSFHAILRHKPKKKHPHTQRNREREIKSRNRRIFIIWSIWNCANVNFIFRGASHSSKLGFYINFMGSPLCDFNKGKGNLSAVQKCLSATFLFWSWSRFTFCIS